MLRNKRHFPASYYIVRETTSYGSGCRKIRRQDKPITYT